MAASFAPPYWALCSLICSRGEGACRWHVVGIAREGTKGLLLPPFGFQLRVPGPLYHAKMNYFTLLPSLSLALPTTATSPPPPPPPTPLLSTSGSATTDGRSCY